MVENRGTHIGKINGKTITSAYTDEVFAFAQYQYNWHSNTNKKAALKQIEAYMLAEKLLMGRQGDKHRQWLIYYVTKDMAESLYALAVNFLEYDHDDFKCAFCRASYEDWLKEYDNGELVIRSYWKFKPVSSQQPMIPTLALQKMLALKETYMVEEDFVVTHRLIPNPVYIICVQFEQWYAGVISYK